MTDALGIHSLAAAQPPSREAPLFSLSEGHSPLALPLLLASGTRRRRPPRRWDTRGAGGGCQANKGVKRPLHRASEIILPLIQTR